MKLSQRFLSAAGDYQLFLDKGYPAKTVLKVVCDRYGLSGQERNLLFRGFTGRENAGPAGSKVIQPEDLSGKELYVDTFNQLFSIVSYLRGTPVFIARDGCLRDVAAVHGKPVNREHLARALSFMVSAIAKLQVGKPVFILDRQVIQSELLAGMIGNDPVLQGKNAEVIITAGADHALSNMPAGVISTSDRTIIDRSVVSVFDLARYTLEFHFHPDFLDLRSV